MNEKPKSKLKFYFYLFITILLISAGLLGYYKYNEYIKLQNSANAALKENATLKNMVSEYDKLRNKLESENNRCEQLLLKEEGNFVEFTYCQKYIEFIDEDTEN